MLVASTHNTCTRQYDSSTFNLNFGNKCLTPCKISGENPAHKLLAIWRTGHDTSMHTCCKRGCFVRYHFVQMQKNKGGMDNQDQVEAL